MDNAVTGPLWFTRLIINIRTLLVLKNSTGDIGLLYLSTADTERRV